MDTEQTEILLEGCLMYDAEYCVWRQEEDKKEREMVAEYEFVQKEDCIL